MSASEVGYGFKGTIVARARGMMRTAWGDDWSRIPEHLREKWRQQYLGIYYTSDEDDEEDCNNDGHGDGDATRATKAAAPQVLGWEQKRLQLQLKLQQLEEDGGETAGDNETPEPVIFVPVVPVSVIGLRSSLVDLCLGRNRLGSGPCSSTCVAITESICQLTALEMLDL
jgi:hypothetical protein